MCFILLFISCFIIWENHSEFYECCFLYGITIIAIIIKVCRYGHPLYSEYEWQKELLYKCELCTHICGTYKNFLNGQTSSRAVELKISLAHSWPNLSIYRIRFALNKNCDVIKIVSMEFYLTPKMGIPKSHSPWKISTTSYKHLIFILVYVIKD
jgi:hypothetical protein